MGERINYSSVLQDFLAAVIYIEEKLLAIAYDTRGLIAAVPTDLIYLCLLMRGEKPKNIREIKIIL